MISDFLSSWVKGWHFTQQEASYAVPSSYKHSNNGWPSRSHRVSRWHWYKETGPSSWTVTQKTTKDMVLSWLRGDDNVSVTSGTPSWSSFAKTLSKKANIS